MSNVSLYNLIVGLTALPLTLTNQWDRGRIDRPYSMPFAFRFTFIPLNFDMPFLVYFVPTDIYLPFHCPKFKYIGQRQTFSYVTRTHFLFTCSQTHHSSHTLKLHARFNPQLFHLHENLHREASLFSFMFPFIMCLARGSPHPNGATDVYWIEAAVFQEASLRLFNLSDKAGSIAFPMVSCDEKPIKGSIWFGGLLTPSFNLGSLIPSTTSSYRRQWFWNIFSQSWSGDSDKSKDISIALSHTPNSLLSSFSASYWSVTCLFSARLFSLRHKIWIAATIKAQFI